ILDRAAKQLPFHVYVVTPMLPEGKPLDKGTKEVRWNEWHTMEAMVNALRADANVGEAWPSYLSFYFLANWSPLANKDWAGGSRRARLQKHQRYMVYVHSK